MAVLEISLARTRLAVRPLGAVFALAAVAWTAYLAYQLADEALFFARMREFIRGTHVISELQVSLGAAAMALALGVVVVLVAPRWLTLLKLLAGAAAIVAMATLTVTSGQTAEVLVFAGLLAWSWFVGTASLPALEGEEALLAGWAHTALETALGLAVLSFCVLAMALLGALNDGGLAVTLVLPALVATVGWRRWRFPRPIRLASRRDEREESLVEYLSLAVLAVSFVYSFGVSLAPQMQFDALHYHFAMPRIFLAEGRLVERPDIIQGYFPLGLEMTYVPALRFGGESTMTLLHWAMAPMLTALVWGGADRFFGRPAGAISAALIGLAALVTYESSSASSDLAMTLWVVAAGIALAAYAAKPAPRLALMAGLFGGLALTFKIVAGIYVIPLALTFVALQLILGRRDVRDSAKETLLFAGGGLLTGAPWLLLRLAQTGNPVFPLYNNVFKSDKWPPVQERFDLWLYGLGHGAGDAGSVWWEIAVHPWRFGQWLTPWSIGMPVLAFVAALLMAPNLVRSRATASMALVALLTAGAWFLLSQYHRYGLPAFSLMALAGGAGIWAALKYLPRPLPVIGSTILLSVWFAGGLVLTMIMGQPGPFPTRVVLGHESREAYRDRATADFYPLQFLDGATKGTDDQAAILGYPYNYFVTNRLYDVIVPETLSPFRRIALSGESHDQMARELLANHIRWLVVDYNPQPGEEQWPPDWLAKGVLSPEFLTAHAEVAFEKYRVVVYRILDP